MSSAPRCWGVFMRRYMKLIWLSSVGSYRLDTTEQSNSQGPKQPRRVHGTSGPRTRDRTCGPRVRNPPNRTAAGWIPAAERRPNSDRPGSAPDHRGGHSRSRGVLTSAAVVEERVRRVSESEPVRVPARRDVSGSQYQFLFM